MIKMLDEIPSITARDLTRLKEVLHPERDGVDLPYSLAFASLEAGQSSLSHKLLGTEVYCVLKGEGTAYLNGKKHPLKTGAVFIVEPNIVQWVTNTGKESLEFYVIVSPPWTEAEETILSGQVDHDPLVD